MGDALELAAYVDELTPDLEGLEIEEVEPGWQDRWRAFHRPVVVGGLWIGPPWEAPPPAMPAVVIDPGRAFGTGSHPTTQLCLQLLQELPHGSLVDVGCGSGVLAIAAAKLGHSPVTAVDVDSHAVEATRRNAVSNGVAVHAYVADAAAERISAADAALANIALDAVQALVPTLDVRVAVTSGYLAHEHPTLPGFRRVDRRSAAEWAADRWERE